MALGRRKSDRQEQLWTVTHNIARSPGHPFYQALNRQLARAGFDRWVEELCEPCYAGNTGRPGIPPGVYFRMLMVGYFEALASQRDIAYRCADSLAVREFLGYGIAESTPDHSSFTRIRQRLPLGVYDEVFVFVLKMANEAGLLEGKSIGVDTTTMEANAAMRSIVRKDTGDDYTEYVRSLMAAEGIEEPTDEDLRRFDRKRKGKKLSNEDWESPTDSDGRIGRMKDGRTDIKYDACNAVQLESDDDIIVEADLLDGDQSEADSLEGTADRTDENLKKAGCERGVKDVAADKGFHKQEVIESCTESGLRTYIPEKESKHRHTWRDKPPEREKAYRRNRTRTKGNRGRRLQRERSEKVERSFAHIMETGGGRRTTLRGLEPNRKRYKMLAMSYNLGRIMRRVFGVGSPRSLQGRSAALWQLISPLLRWIFGGMAPRWRRSAFSD